MAINAPVDGAPENPQAEHGAPRVLVLSKKSGKKRKYSRSAEHVQRMERGGVKAAIRASRAIATGFAEYRRRSGDSAEKKRDGALKDAVENWAKAMSKATRKISGVHGDLAKAVSGKRYKRRGRRYLLALFPFLR